MQPILLLKNKISMPKWEPAVFLRSDLEKKLGNIKNYPVTVVCAGAGYGKTTTVSYVLSQMDTPCCWYSPGPEDDNAFTFTSYLAGALDSLIPGFKEWYTSSMHGEKRFNWKIAFSNFMAGVECLEGQRTGGIIVVDDWHHVQHDNNIRLFFDRFLACLPSDFKIIVLSRENINLSEVDRLRTKSQVLSLNEKDLAFNVSDVETFFGMQFHYSGRQYSAEEISRIYEVTEGWIMAIKLVANHPSEQEVAEILKFDFDNVGYSRLDAFFKYLAHDVFERQSASLQKFLLKTSILSSFDSQTCQAIFGEPEAILQIHEAKDHGLFVIEGERGFFRYHPLFHEFLRREAGLRLSDINRLHNLAGKYYQKNGELESALRHYLKGQFWIEAQAVLSDIGRELVKGGRSRAFHDFLQQIPSNFQNHPGIVLALGDEERRVCNYKRALQRYDQARQLYEAGQSLEGVSIAYLSAAEVYLDIIQPLEAQLFLRRSYKALPKDNRKDRADLLGLMAENMVNQGNPRYARKYTRLACEIFYPFGLEDRNNLEARILLRTGKIRETVEMLQARFSIKSTANRLSYSFRESSLISSICYSYLGEAEKAYNAAQEGIDTGELLKAPFVSSIGYARLGHALLIRRPFDWQKCWDAYQMAWDLGKNLEIPRSHTEVLQGRCLLFALKGNWEEAEKCGLQGVRITDKVQDRWFTAILYHCLGISAVLCEKLNEAEIYLSQSLRLFIRCGNHFGQAAAYFWLSYLVLKLRMRDKFREYFTSFTQLCKDYDYDCFMLRPSLMGNLADIPVQELWGEARLIGIPEKKDDEAAFQVNSQAAKLKMQVLGPLRIWTGTEDNEISEWRRESSKRLFFLLLSTRKNGLNKERAMEYLWPEENFLAANTKFKVALSNLMNVLEPYRQPRGPSSFILRQGSVYRLNLSPFVYVDVEEFENLLLQFKNLKQLPQNEAERILRCLANIYQGEYLQGEILDEISAQEREKLKTAYIKANEALFKFSLGRREFEEALYWAEKILQQDICYERGYQYKMVCYGRMNDQVMVARTYRKCETVLQQELGVKPTSITTDLLRRLTSA